jgi:hypothetical protein
VDAANFRSCDRDWAAGNNLAMSVDFLNGAGDAPGIQIRTLRNAGDAFGGADARAFNEQVKDGELALAGENIGHGSIPFQVRFR